MKVGFIGAGNMARSLVKGLLASGFCSENIIVSNRGVDKLTRFSEALGVQTASSNIELVEKTDIIVLAIKPNQHKEVISDIKIKLLALPEKLLITVAIAVTSECIQRWLGRGYPVIRMMPNTPTQLKKGVIALWANEQVSIEFKKVTIRIFSHLGVLEWCDQERQIDLVASIAGNGPAYLFYIMQSWVQAASAIGLEEELAIRLVLQTVAGSCAMGKEGGGNLSSLLSQVVSPGGSTQAALEVFDRHDMVGGFIEAIKASGLRIDHLKKTMEGS